MGEPEARFIKLYGKLKHMFLFLLRAVTDS